MYDSTKKEDNMGRPKVVITVPRSVRLTEELDEYRKTLPHGEFSKLVNELLTKYVKENGGNIK